MRTLARLALRVQTLSPGAYVLFYASIPASLTLAAVAAQRAVGRGRYELLIDGALLCTVLVLGFLTGRARSGAYSPRA